MSIKKEVVQEVKKLFNEDIKPLEGKPAYNSPHEMWGHMYEEVKEAWDLVRKKKENRDSNEMLQELNDVLKCVVRAIYTIKNDPNWIQRGPGPHGQNY